MHDCRGPIDITNQHRKRMRYSIHDKSNNAKKARILINALVDCAKPGIKPSFAINQMMRGLCLSLECGTFMRENWRTYHRVSEAAKLIRDSGDKDWKRHVSFEHVPRSTTCTKCCSTREPR